MNKLTIYYGMSMMGAYCPEDGQSLGHGMNLTEKGWRKYLDQFEPARLA